MRTSRFGRWVTRATVIALLGLGALAAASVLSGAASSPDDIVWAVSWTTGSR